MSGAGCSHDCKTCSITPRACSLSPGLFLLHKHGDLKETSPTTLIEILKKILPVEGEGEVELDHGLSGQITSREHLQSLDQFHHCVIVLIVTGGRWFSLPLSTVFTHMLPSCTCMSLYENSRFMTISWVRTSVLSMRSLIRESSFASSSP